MSISAKLLGIVLEQVMLCYYYSYYLRRAVGAKEWSFFIRRLCDHTTFKIIHYDFSSDSPGHSFVLFFFISALYSLH